MKQSHIVTAKLAQGKPWRGLATVNLYFLEAWSSLWCWPKVHITLHWFLSWLESTIFTLLCSLRLCTLLLQRPTSQVIPEPLLRSNSVSLPALGGTHKHILYIAERGTKNKEHSFPGKTIFLAQISASSLCDPVSKIQRESKKKNLGKVEVIHGNNAQIKNVEETENHWASSSTLDPSHGIA